MKSKLVTLLAVSLFAIAAPALAENSAQHGATHKAVHDAQCEKDCDLLLKNCAQEVDSIQDRIKKLQVLIKEKGATNATKDELKVLNRKLAEANDTLRILNKH